MLGFFVIIVCVVLGVFAGLIINMPLEMSNVIGTVIVACIYVLINGVKQSLKKEFNIKYFLLIFLGNILFAFGLSFIGEKIGVSIYFGVIVVYIAKIMTTLSTVYNLFRKKIKDTKKEE